MKRNRCRHARCARCGYDLRGRSSRDLCPECGASIAESLANWRDRKRWRMSSWRLLIAFLWTFYILCVVVFLLNYNYQNYWADFSILLLIVSVTTGIALGIIGTLSSLIPYNASRHCSAKYTFAGAVTLFVTMFVLLPLTMISRNQIENGEFAALIVVQAICWVTIAFVIRYFVRIWRRRRSNNST